MRIKSSISILSIILASATTLHADIVFDSPDAVSATNTNHPAPVQPENLIDQSGLSSSLVTLDNIESIQHSDGNATDLWRGSSSALPITLTFEFSEARRIQYVALWQGLQLREGTRDFHLRFFDGGGGSGNQIGTTYSDVLDTGAGGNNSILLNGRLFEVGTRDDVESMTLEITSVAHLVNPHVHLGEVMVASVPEPASFGLLLLAGSGLLFRRNRILSIRSDGNDQNSSLLFTRITC